MKKLSLMLVFVMLFAALFALSVFADGTSFTITADHIESVKVERNCNGEEISADNTAALYNIFDGNTAAGDSGWFGNWPKWSGKDADNCGSKATIVLKDEYLINSAQLYIWTNWNNLVTFKFYDAKGNETNSASGPQSVTDGTVQNLSGRDYKAKTIVIEFPAVRSHIYLSELVLTAQEVPSCTHDIGTCMKDFDVIQEATCTSPAVIQYECTNCGDEVTTTPAFDDVTDYAFQSTIVTNGNGGYNSGPMSMFDNNMDTHLTASGGWFVYSQITLNRTYYINSVTVWISADNNYNPSKPTYMTVSYMKKGETEWVVAGTKSTPIDYSGTKYEYTYELETPVEASKIMIRFDNLDDYQGYVWEAEVAGSLLAEAGVKGHAWVAGETVAPTCAVVGYTPYTCSECGATKRDDINSTLVEHTWADATCEAPKTCTVCNKKEGNAIGHNYEPGEKAEDGSVTYTCTNNCGSYYVINNSAVNGEYFLGTDALVFADGVLTVMGTEYSYENNVTTGMLTTNDETMYFTVREGVIYYKDAQPLHQHVADSYIAEQQDDYSVNYICKYCGIVAYTVNNSSINGVYYLGTDEVVFADGVLTAMGSEFAYTYKVLEEMVVTDNEGIYFQVIDGKLYFKGATALHQHTGEGYVAEEQEDGSVNYICNDCGTVMYVINNAALNGTYYADLMTSFVFADGVLTANGETYNYTYNATTQELTVEGLPEGMLAVVDGKIVFRGRVELHQHNEENFIVETTDATCTEDGKIETICQICGVLNTEVIPAGHTQAYDVSDEETGYVGAYVYVPATCITDGYAKDKCSVCGEVFVVYTEEADLVWFHFAVEGTYTQVDATCNAAGSYSYVCEYCGETISDVIEADPYAHVYGEGAIVDNKLVYTCEVCGGTEEKDVVILEVGDNTIEFPGEYVEWFGGYWYESVTVVMSVPGKYTVSVANASIELVIGRFSTEAIDLPYEFEVLEGGYVAFNVSDIGEATATITIEEAGCKHTNTTEIPAVPSTSDENKVVTPGMTSGVKCADCGEILVAQEVADIGFNINGRALNISESLKIIYRNYVPAGYENVRMVINFRGNTYEIKEYTIDEKTGRYCFDFTAITPQYMNVNIEAWLLAEKDGKTVAFIQEEYSIKTYCLNNLAKSSSTTSLKTLLTDLLIYGEKLQKYVGGDCLNNGLITEGVDLSYASTFAELDASFDKRVIPDKVSDELPYWSTATLYIANSVSMKFKFYAPSVEGLEIKVTVKGRTTTFDADDFVLGTDGRYEITFTNVTALEFDETVKASFYLGGELVENATLEYTINSYIQRYQNYNSATLVEFLRALNNYGRSAYKYVNG